MPLDMKATRTITRTATIELSEAEIIAAIKQYVIREEKSLKDYTLAIDLTNCGVLAATVTATLTTEREQGETP